MLKRVLHAPVWLYRWHLGWLLGYRFLMLTHVGRRTSLTRQTVLEVLRYDRPTGRAVVMSGFGPRCDWMQNLAAGSSAEISIGRSRRRLVTYRVLAEDDAVDVLLRYERRNRVVAPLVRGVLSRLLGWRYTGTDGDRRRAVAQLPLVAFTPVG